MKTATFQKRKFVVLIIANLVHRSRANSRDVGDALQSRSAKSWILGKRNPPLAESPRHQTTSDSAPRSKSSRYDPERLPAAKIGNQRGNFLRIPPDGGDRTSTSTPQEEPCPSRFPQTIRSPANPRRCEAKSGINERPASIRVKAQNLRDGCAWRIAHYLSRKSTSWRSSPAAACTFEPGKRVG